MVKAIIFDCFGVLTTDYWKEFIATLSDKHYEQARELNYLYNSGSINRTEFLKDIKKITGRVPKEVEKLLDNQISKNDDLIFYIAELKSKYRIGLLSNIGSDWISRSFLKDNEQALFDQMIFSYEVGMAKPDSEIFKLAAQRLGVLPVDCIMVDDSEGHCEAAVKLGMQAIVYKNFRQMKHDLTKLVAV